TPKNADRAICVARVICGELRLRTFMAEAGEKKSVGIFGRYRNLSRTVFALSFVSFLNDTSSEIIYPLLPAFLALSLGASPFAIGLIEGIAESVASLLKLFSGYV